MEQATYDEVRRKMADAGRDRFSVLIADTDEALVEVIDLVHDSGVWWSEGRPHEPAGPGRQRLRFVRLSSDAAEQVFGPRY
jgi:hypothetical protein